MTIDTIKEFGNKVQHLINGGDLNRDESFTMFKEVLQADQPDLHQGAFLAALVAKGETVEEIAGAWEAIDAFDTVHTGNNLPAPLFENSGTGMDSLKTFNVSSAAAIVAASCGVKMARHGARGITSNCGTVDILEAVGVDVECDVETIENSIREAGIGLFNGMSPKIHPGALGRILSQIRFGSTLNIAASLANPARPTLGLRGVYNERLLRPAAEVMREIGYERCLVVYGKDRDSGQGMDELSVCGETLLYECTPGTERSYAIQPEDVGLQTAPFEKIAFTGDIRQETDRFLRVLAGKEYQECIDFTCLNAGAILSIAEKCGSLRDGVTMSRNAIKQGAALSKLRDWVTWQDSTDGEGVGRLENLLAST